MLHRGKSQVVYKFLPGMWISDNSDGGEPVSAKITTWIPHKMEGIYENFIENEIKRQIGFFKRKNGDVSSYDLTKPQSLRIVEPALEPGIPDIIAEISPLVFYCSACESVFSLKKASDISRDTFKCTHCGKYAVKQLQMIYACECGYAAPVTTKRISGLKYRASDKGSQFKFFYTVNGLEKTEEMTENCPTCGKRLTPDNANSGRNYKPFTLSVINLLNEKCGSFYEKGLPAQKTVIAKWFGKISPEDYDYVINNVELAFSDAFKNDTKRREAEEQVRALIAAGIIPESMFEQTVQSLLGSAPNRRSIESYVTACDELFAAQKSANEELYEDWVNYYSFKLMQYYTIRESEKTITLADSKAKQMALEFIESEEEVDELNEKLGIRNMQVSCDIQMVNCTYGFTRRAKDPAKSGNTNCLLKLNAYAKTKDGEANLVYGSKLDTEGILFDISQRKIVEWIFANGIITEQQLPDLEDEISVKKWFAENVHGDVISNFGEIEGDSKITQCVFALLHSMSHAFINAAGEISGLAANSLTEIVFVETASIFLYSQTNQEITLGSLSGMAETNYAAFLRRAWENSRICVFDPICAERDDTACSACMIIPEVSCKFFNANLGRKYLYSIPGAKEIQTGFWEM